MAVNKKALEQFLARPLQSYNWIKKLSEDELWGEIDSLKVKPKFKTEPWKHQLACFLIGLSEPYFLFLLDMGAGKSKLMLDLLTQRQREKKLNHALVTVPRLVNLGSWEADILRHSDFEPTLCQGSIAEKWDSLLHPKGEISIIDYPGLQLALSSKLGGGKKGKLVRDDRKIAQLKKLYGNIIIDESQKAKNKDTLRFGILRQLTKDADSVYSTTGTLFGRDIENIWPQFYLVDGGETFGESIGMFRHAYMKEVPDYWKGSSWEFDKKKARNLYRALQNRSIRYDETEFDQKLPEKVLVQLKVRLSREQQEHYNRAVDGLINASGQLKDLDGAWIRMRQIVAGALIWKDEYGPHQIKFKDNPKLEAVEKIVEESGDSKVVISHEYTVSGELITERLTQLGYGYEWLHGGTKNASGCVARFINDPKKKVFVMNSESGGTGTDGLQEVAPYLVFYESPPSPMTRKQTEKRVHRPGQKKRTFIYDIVAEKTVDFGILGFLAQGREMHNAVVDGQFVKEVIRTGLIT